MSNCIPKTFKFPVLKSRKIEAAFNGGSITSDGGSLLLRQVEQKTKSIPNSENAVWIRDKEKPKRISPFLNMSTRYSQSFALERYYD